MRFCLLAVPALFLIGCASSASVSNGPKYPAPTGTALNDSCIWIDRMLIPGQTDKGQYWASYTDSANGGASQIIPAIPSQAWHNTAGGGILHFDYKLDRAKYVWDPYVGTGFDFNPDQIPWDSVFAVAYEYRGSEHSLQWLLSSVNDYGNYQKLMPASDQWRSALIPFINLKQPFWAKRVNWDPKLSKGFQWMITGKSGTKGDLEIAQVRLILKGHGGTLSLPSTSGPKLASTGVEANALLPIDSANWLPQAAFGQTVPSRWKGNRLSAYSLSFDDGLQSQIDIVAPLLEKYGLRGTFYLISGVLAEDGDRQQWHYGTWKDFLALDKKGHELGVHTVSHPHLPTLAMGSIDQPNTIQYELLQSKNELERRTHKTAFSLAYPYGETNSAINDLTRKLFISSRGVTGYVNLEDFDPAIVSAQDFTYDAPRNLDNDEMVKDIARVRILQFMAAKGWSVYFGHDILPMKVIPGATDSWKPVSAETFEPFVKWLARLQDHDSLWVAPVGEVARYARERKFFHAGILEITPDHLSIQTNSGLPNVLFNEPLTLNTSLPLNWKRVVAQGVVGKDTLDVIDGKVRYEAIPGSKITFRVLP